MLVSFQDGGADSAPEFFRSVAMHIAAMSPSILHPEEFDEELVAKETEALHKAATKEETLDWIVAFVQLYREGGKYLDRPYKWVAKVGLDWVKETLASDETRAALVARFDHAQTIFQTDPWAERAAPKPARKFAPLVDLTLEAAE